MTYAKAVAAVEPFVTKHAQYSVVLSSRLPSILSEDGIALLKSDFMLRGRPSGCEGYYSWNVAAALFRTAPEEEEDPE